MDIERLKELSEYTSNLCFIALSKLTDKNARENVVAYGEGVKEFIDEAIARQTVTSEEVQRAIEQLKYAREQDREFDDGTFVDSLDLAITALQAYQPWIPCTERMPTKSELRNGMVLVWSTELDEWQVENWGYVEDRPEDYTHWKPLPEPPKGE